jgi:hypothetical protein
MLLNLLNFDILTDRKRIHRRTEYGHLIMIYEPLAVISPTSDVVNTYI